MKGMTRQEQSAQKFRCHAGLNETKIELLVASINFIADDRVPDRRKMDADLVQPPCHGAHTKQRKFFQPFFHLPLCS